MTKNTLYKMTERIFGSLKTRGNTELKCRTCSQKIKIGDEVFSVIKTHGRVLRHTHCARKVGLL